MVPIDSSAQSVLRIVLRPRRAKWVRYLLMSLLFVGIGFVERTPGTLVAASFFGLCAAVFGIMLLPGAAYLTIDSDGFTTCSLFRKHRTAWRDAGPFGVTQVSRQALVGYDSTERAARRPRLAAVNAALTGYRCALPDTYGLSAPELAKLMNEARRRASP